MDPYYYSAFTRVNLFLSDLHYVLGYHLAAPLPYGSPVGISHHGSQPLRNASGYGGFTIQAPSRQPTRRSKSWKENHSTKTIHKSTQPRSTPTLPPKRRHEKRFPAAHAACVPPVQKVQRVQHIPSKVDHRLFRVRQTDRHENTENSCEIRQQAFEQAVNVISPEYQLITEQNLARDYLSDHDQSANELDLDVDVGPAPEIFGFPPILVPIHEHVEDCQSVVDDELNNDSLSNQTRTPSPTEPDFDVDRHSSDRFVEPMNPPIFSDVMEAPPADRIEQEEPEIGHQHGNSFSDRADDRSESVIEDTNNTRILPSWYRRPPSPRHFSLASKAIHSQLYAVPRLKSPAIHFRPTLAPSLASTLHRSPPAGFSDHMDGRADKLDTEDHNTNQNDYISSSDHDDNQSDRLAEEDVDDLLDEYDQDYCSDNNNPNSHNFQDNQTDAYQQNEADQQQFDNYNADQSNYIDDPGEIHDEQVEEAVYDDHDGGYGGYEDDGYEEYQEEEDFDYY